MSEGLLCVIAGMAVATFLQVFLVNEKLREIERQLHGDHRQGRHLNTGHQGGSDGQKDS